MLLSTKKNYKFKNNNSKAILTKKLKMNKNWIVRKLKLQKKSSAKSGGMCREPESNWHGRLNCRGILSPLCLPIPPSRHR